MTRFGSVIIASHNPGKIKEFKSLFAIHKVKVSSSIEMGIPDVDETGESFEDNALIKINSVPKNIFAIADDSGLCVDALDGRPGIYSARYALKYGGWNNAMERIYTQIKNSRKPVKTASFFCALAVNIPNEKVFIYTGRVKGEIVWPPYGKNGFGYDPFFVPAGFKQTFGQIEHSKKIYLDHRFEAFKKFARKHLNYIYKD